jgi:hypothetical protein
MMFLPIVGRELRVASRRRGTFRIRTVVALGAIGVGVFFYLANIEATTSILAHRLFFGLVVLGMVFCLFAGRQFTADCLSIEKRGGTLGLLFLTDLKGYDIVLGKLAATSLNGFYSLLAVFPVMAVPILLGGVTQAEFWRAVLVLANTFVFSLAVGMFVSALCKDARRAMGANLLVLLLIIAIPGACGALLAYFLPSQRFHEVFLCSCPLYSLYLSDASVYFVRRAPFWWSVALLHVLTWILLGLASYAVRKSWQDRPAEPRGNVWRKFWSFLSFGPYQARAAFRRRLLSQNAFYWLAARARFKPLHVWLVLLCVAAWWIGARLQFGPLWLTESSNGNDIAAAIMLNFALKVWVGLEACRELAEDRQSGAFELLLSTPLTVEDFVRGQCLALKRQFLIPVLIGAVVAFTFMLVAISHSALGHGQVVLVWVGAMLMFAADVVALFWTGMYGALISRSPNQAAIITISRIVIAPGVLLTAIVVLGNVYAYLSSRPGPEFGFYLAWWFGLGLTADLIYGVTSRRRFLARFRHLAAEGGGKTGHEDAGKEISPKLEIAKPNFA